MIPNWNTIAEEYPGISVRSAQFIGEGWCFRSYLINGELVFRFPKRREQWTELDREIKFLEFAADRLPLQVPRYEHAARSSEGAPFGYAVYRYVPGKAITVNSLTVPQRAAAAEALAEFLIALHNLRPDAELSSILPQEDARVVAEQYFSDATFKIAPQLPAAEAQALGRHFESYLSAPDNFIFRPSVLHADFSADHILVQDGRVTGVLDFGDVNWGDPDYDFMYLFVECGNPFLDELAKRYGHTDLARLRQKVRYFGIVDQIGTILDASLALEGQVDEAWFRLKKFLKNS